MSDKKYGVTDIAKDFVLGRVEYVDGATQNKRMDICRECPFFNKTLVQCKQCGCFLKAKVKFTNSSCPINKW